MQEGETPRAQSLSAIQLGWVPWFEGTCASPLSPEEIAARLAEHVGPLWGPKRGAAFLGFTGASTFRVCVRDRQFGILSPTLRGSIERTPHGSLITIRLRPNLLVAPWLAVMTAMTALGLVGGLLGASLERVVGGSLGLLAWVPVAWAMRRHGPSLLALLEDTCSATLLPGAGPPTTF